MSYCKGVCSHSWGQGGEACQSLQAKQTLTSSQAKDMSNKLLGGEDLGSSHNAPYHSQQTVGSLLLIPVAQETCRVPRYKVIPVSKTDVIVACVCPRVPQSLQSMHNAENTLLGC